MNSLFKSPAQLILIEQYVKFPRLALIEASKIAERLPFVNEREFNLANLDFTDTPVSFHNSAQIL